MKRIAILLLTLVGTLLLPGYVLADANKHEWFGNWNMNHDGRPGTLIIAELKADCATSPWCDMAVNYIGSDGIRRTGGLEKIDDKWQHMVFYINFPGNRQKFDAYLFSWDKQKMAGTTYWGGRTFGFYATRKLNSKAISTASVEVLSPISIKELREIEQRLKPEELLRARPNRPQFSISDNAFVFYQGDLPYLQYDLQHGPTGNAAKPILIPLARLMQLEDLRQFIKHHPEADPVFWEPYFNRAEAIIEQKMLGVISSGGSDGKVIREQLLSYDSAINKIFEEEAPTAFADLRKLRRNGPTLIALSKYLVQVIFRIDPPAQLFVVPETTYDIAGAFNEEPPWREILEDKPRLGGWYWIKVVWPGDAPRQSRILVDEANTEFKLTR
jgi:hypothetical protein